MRNKIKQKIQKAQAAAEFGIELIVNRRGRGKAAREGYKKITLRDSEGNHITKEGSLVLPHIRVEKTLSPREQYQQSARNPYRKEI